MKKELRKIIDNPLTGASPDDVKAAVLYFISKKYNTLCCEYVYGLPTALKEYNDYYIWVEHINADRDAWYYDISDERKEEFKTLPKEDRLEIIAREWDIDMTFWLADHFHHILSKGYGVGKGDKMQAQLEDEFVGRYLIHKKLYIFDPWLDKPIIGFEIEDLI